MHIGIGILPRLIYAFTLNIVSIIILNLSFKLKDVTINSILSFKIISYVFMVLCIYFKIDEFLTVSNNEGTIYEFLLYLFNNLYTISYFIVFCFMAFALNLLKKNEFKNSLLCDFKNILIVICKFMAIFLALSLLIATFKMDLSLEWSEFNKSSEEFVSIYKTYTPLFVLFISVIHISLYLFSIAFICITLSKMSKNTILGLITTFGLIILNISTSIGRIPALTTFSLSRNAMSTFSLNSQSGYLYFVPSLIYWICLIIVICNIYNDYCDVKLNIKLKNKKSITR